MSVPEPVGICDRCSCPLWEESEIGQKCGRSAPLNGVCRGRFVPYEQHMKASARGWAERLIEEERERILDMPMLFIADIDALLVHTKSLALHYNKYAATATEVRERLAFIAALATDLLEGFYPNRGREQ